MRKQVDSNFWKSKQSNQYSDLSFFPASIYFCLFNFYHSNANEYRESNTIQFIFDFAFIVSYKKYIKSLWWIIVQMIYLSVCSFSNKLNRSIFSLLLSSNETNRNRRWQRCWFFSFIILDVLRHPIIYFSFFFSPSFRSLHARKRRREICL